MIKFHDTAAKSFMQDAAWLKAPIRVVPYRCENVYAVVEGDRDYLFEHRPKQTDGAKLLALMEAER